LRNRFKSKEEILFLNQFKTAGIYENNISEKQTNNKEKSIDNNTPILEELLVKLQK